MTDPIHILEAAYATRGDDASWLAGIASTAGACLDAGAGIVACIYDATRDGGVALRQVVAPGVDPQMLRAILDPPFAASSDEACFMVRLFRRVTFASIHDAGILPAVGAYFRSVVGRFGLSDLRWVNATDPTHLGCMLAVPSERRRRWSPRESNRWRLIAAHVAAGLRVRRKLAAWHAEAIRPAPETTPLPDGPGEHADEHTRGALARELLRRSARDLAGSRGSLRAQGSDEALRIWKGLVAGRWSLVDHIDADGRRFVLAHRNDPGAPDVRGFSRRERQVLSYVALGHPNKVIAYSLGLTTSTVAGHLRRARSKLGLRSLDPLRDVVMRGNSAQHMS